MISITDPAYGADPTGVTDSTAAIQSALNAGAGAVLAPPGTYLISAPLQVPARTSFTGYPSAVSKTSPGKQSVLTLAGGSNNHMIVLDGQSAYVADLELDGNKAGQTSGYGNGILAAGGADWGIIERCYIHDQYFRGIDITGCEAIRVHDCSVQSCGDAGIFLDSDSSDHLIDGCLIGSNAGSNIWTQAYVVHITGCDIWSSSLSGITVDGSGGSWGTMITNCGIDRNSEHGIVITSSGVTVSACTFHTNGQGANNAYASVVVDDTSYATTAVAVEGCSFWQDPGYTSKVAYHIQYKHTATAKTHGNGFQAGSYATAQISSASAAKATYETG